MQIDNLKTRLNELGPSLIDKYGAHSVSIGFKEKNGIITDELSVVFHVVEKKQEKDIQHGKVIPKKLGHLSLNVVTDVVESEIAASANAVITDEQLNNKVESNDLLANNGDDYILKDSDKHKITLSNLGTANKLSVDYWNDPSGSTHPVSMHRATARPLSGGISSMTALRGSATLGLIVTDSTDGTPVLLSNNHVFGASMFAGAESKYYGEYGNTLPLSSVQPSLGDGGTRADIVGKTKRVVPFRTNGYNFVDAAITTVSDNTTIDNKILHFNQDGPYEFASTEEIDSLLDYDSPNFKAPIFRSGRTLGPIGYPGNQINKTVTKKIINKPNTVDIETHFNITNVADAGLFKIANLENAETKTNDKNYLLIKQNNNDYHAAGASSVAGFYRMLRSSSTNKLYPHQELDINQRTTLEPIGNFDYLSINSQGSIGVSANELMYYSGSIAETSVIFTRESGNTAVGSLPFYLPLAQGDEFLRMPISVNFDPTNISFTLSAAGNTKDFTIYGKPTSLMDSVSGDYTKVGDKMFIRVPDDGISYNDSPYIGLSHDGGGWGIYLPGNSFNMDRENPTTRQALIGSNYTPTLDALTGTDSFGGIPLTAINVDHNNINEELVGGFSGVRKILNGYAVNPFLGSTWLLSGNDILTIGSNGDLGCIGALSAGGEHNVFTKLHGEWNDIYSFGSGVLALSTSGDIFYSYPKYKDQNFINRVRTIVSPNNSYDLSANNLSEEIFDNFKFKKLFCSNESYYWCYGIGEDDRLYWLNLWYGVKYKFNKNGNDDPWDHTITTCYATHNGSANHFFSEGSSTYFVNINSISERSLSMMKRNKDNDIIFDALYAKWGRSGIPGFSTTLISDSLLSASGNSFGFKNDFYEVDNICGYDNNTSSWVMAGENIDNVFCETSTFNDDIIVSDLAVNAGVTGLVSGRAITFRDLIAIRSKNKHFPVTQGGDSGTAVFAKFGNTWKVIGLIFAGPTPTNEARGFVCRIDRIQEQLKIQPWDGSIPSETIRTENIFYNTTKQTLGMVTLSGRDYYNIGAGSLL